MRDLGAKDMTTPEQMQSNPEQPTLRDETLLIREKLKKLVDTKERFMTNVDGLFLVQPGKEYSGVYSVDKGCRGGWDEHYTATLGLDPVEVKHIQGGPHNIGFALTGGGASNMNPRDIDTARFLVNPSEWSYEQPGSSIDQKIRDELTGTAYGLLTAEMATNMTDWEHRIYVRSRFPLDHPVSYRPLHSDFSTTREALQGPFSYLETYHDTTAQTTYAQVTVYEDRHSNVSVTDWMPLDHLVFYEHEQHQDFAFEAHIGHLARVLTEGETDTTDINDLLSRYDSFYKIHRETNLEGHTERVVTGRHELGTITNVGAVAVRKASYFYGLNIPAHHVVVAHDQPWVVDESGLAVPLKQPDNFTLTKYLRTSDASTIGQLIEPTAVETT